MPDMGVVSLPSACSGWGRFQELELKIVYLSLPLLVLPEVLIYMDRLWFGARRVKVFIS